MIGTMPRRKKDAPAPEPQGREAFQLPIALIESLSAFVDEHKPATTKSAVMRLALEEFLERNGYWPAPKPSRKSDK